MARGDVDAEQCGVDDEGKAEKVAARDLRTMCVPTLDCATDSSFSSIGAS
eukprot:m.112688 g.112688  ORF g.112688 m.112688 type:complete len:50 (-) comp22840_c0_seq1:209-358(-)